MPSHNLGLGAGRQAAGRAAELRRIAANDVFSDTPRLPTLRVPCYPGCSQHASDEDILLSVTEEARGIVAGLFSDLGEMPRPLVKAS